MGAWGFATFENDDAADWVFAFEENGAAAIEEALANLGEADDYLEAPECCEALAAAEVVAAARTSNTSHLSQEAADALAKHGHGIITPDHVTSAQTAVRRVRGNSELRELWEESDDFPAWLADVKRLERVLAKR